MTYITVVCLINRKCGSDVTEVQMKFVISFILVEYANKIYFQYYLFIIMQTINVNSKLI